MNTYLTNAALEKALGVDIVTVRRHLRAAAKDGNPLATKHGPVWLVTADALPGLGDRIAAAKASGKFQADNYFGKKKPKKRAVKRIGVKT